VDLSPDWVAGFVEGEGTFSGSMRAYDYFQPNFSVYQKDRIVLELVQAFFQANGIEGKIYLGTNNCHTYNVSGKARCRKVYELLRPHMHAPVKIAQAEAWYEKIQPK
jgi:hypothetical protein